MKSKEIDAVVQQFRETPSEWTQIFGEQEGDCPHRRVYFSIDYQQVYSWEEKGERVVRTIKS